jgi:WD40 repeat protein
VAWDPAGKFFVTCSEDRTVRVWPAFSSAVIDSRVVKGVVAFISPQVEIGSGGHSLRFHVEADNSAGVLVPNSPASVLFN